MTTASNVSARKDLLETNVVQVPENKYILV